jgi:hypothetical protein
MNSLEKNPDLSSDDGQKNSRFVLAPLFNGQELDEHQESSNGPLDIFDNEENNNHRQLKGYPNISTIENRSNISLVEKLQANIRKIIQQSYSVNPKQEKKLAQKLKMIFLNGLIKSTKSAEIKHYLVRKFDGELSEQTIIPPKVCKEINKMKEKFPISPLYIDDDVYREIDDLLEGICTKKPSLPKDKQVLFYLLVESYQYYLVKSVLHAICCQGQKRKKKIIPANSRYSNFNPLEK